MFQRLLISNNDATNGSSQPLGEAQAHCVKLSAKLIQGTRAGGDSLPEPGAVAVHLDAVFAGELGDALNLTQWVDHAVESVFEADDAGGTVVDVVADDDVGFDVLEGEMDAVFGDDGLDSSTSQGRDAV